jgi:SAM-dependent methyltransferase
VKKKEWFNDTRFWENFSPIIFDEVHWAESSQVADAITHFSQFNFYGETATHNWNEPLKSVPKVLDLCCGLGRISTELALMGYDVTGVDITKAYLKIAKEDAQVLSRKNKNLKIEYILADVREFVRPGYFDTIVNLYISFGYFKDKKDDLLVLKNVYKSLKKGGTFIIETLGKEVAIRDFVESEWFEHSGYTVLTEYQLLDSCSFLKNRWIIIKGDKKYEKIFVQRLYSASELRDSLQEAGFSDIQIYGDWDESEYDHKARMLIAVCRK